MGRDGLTECGFALQNKISDDYDVGQTEGIYLLLRVSRNVCHTELVEVRAMNEKVSRHQAQFATYLLSILLT